MIRWITREGRFVEHAGWSKAIPSLSAEESLLLYAEVGLPESLEATPATFGPLARALVPRGVLCVECADPRIDPKRGGGTSHSERIRLAGVEVGLSLEGSRPKHVQEREFLTSALGYSEAWFGLSEGEVTSFAEITFRKVSPAASSRRIKLGLITFDLYFRPMYESPALRALFDLHTVECRPFAPPEAYRSLLEFRPDFVFVFRPDYFLPETLRAFQCPVVGLATEPLPRRVEGRVVASEYNARCYELLRKVRGLCDRLYHYDEACVEFLQSESFPVTGVFPPCVCTDVYRPDPQRPPRWDVVFIGKSTERRERYLSHLALMCRYAHVAHGLAGAEELLPFLNSSKIGLNLHRDETPNLEPRLFLHLACGLFTLTEELPRNPWLREGEHYVAFRSEQEMIEQLRHYLHSPEERKRVAVAGRRWAVRHADALGVWPRLAREVLNDPCMPVFP